MAHRGKKHRKNPKRVAAGKKAYRKMKRLGRGIAAHHGRKGRKGHRKGKGKGHRKGKGHKRHHVVAGVPAWRMTLLKKKFPRASEKVLRRLARMHESRAHRAALQAVKEREAAGFFGALGHVGRLAA
jgi:hypothetical protein